MKKNEVKNMIYGRLNEVLTIYGFRLKKSEESFVRTYKGCEQRIYVPLVDYQPDFVISLTMGIRLDEVEKIYHAYSGAMSKYQPLSMTSLTQLGYFTEGVIKDYKVSSEVEISIALNDILKIVTEKVMPFFEKYFDIPSVEKGVNDGTANSIDSTQLPSGAMHAVILAHLTGNQSFEQLIQKFQDKMKNFPLVEKEKFNQLIAHLKRGH